MLTEKSTDFLGGFFERVCFVLSVVYLLRPCASHYAIFSQYQTCPSVSFLWCWSWNFANHIFALPSDSLLGFGNSGRLQETTRLGEVEGPASSCSLPVGCFWSCGSSGYPLAALHLSSISLFSSQQLNPVDSFSSARRNSCIMPSIIKDISSRKQVPPSQSSVFPTLHGLFSKMRNISTSNHMPPPQRLSFSPVVPPPRFHVSIMPLQSLCSLSPMGRSSFLQWLSPWYLNVLAFSL